MKTLKWFYADCEYAVDIADERLYAEMFTSLVECGYIKLQLCGCSFNGGNSKLYSYTAIGLYVRENDKVVVPVEDEYGYRSEVLAVVKTVKSATIEDIRKAAALIGRKRLKSIIAVV